MRKLKLRDVSKPAHIKQVCCLTPEATFIPLDARCFAET